MELIDNIENTNIQIISKSEARKMKLCKAVKHYTTIIHEAIVNVVCENNNYYAYLYSNNELLEKYLIEDLTINILDHIIVDKVYTVLNFPDEKIMRKMEKTIDDYVNDKIIIKK